MNRFFAVVVMLLAAASFSGSAYADGRSSDVDRIQDAATVLDEVMSTPDRGIPEEILGSAKCVAVVPAMLKGAFIFGVNRGKGIASCRTADGWSTPAFFVLEGGSVGFQIGGQAVDLVMLVMNDNGMRKLLSSKFELGADASVAAGPVGRHAEGMTDWKLRAEVLTYSRARGAFAGASLNGASIRQHRDDTRAFYGRMVPFRTLLLGNLNPAPEDAAPWLAMLKKYAPSAPAKTTTAPAPPAAAPAPSEAAPPPRAAQTPAPEVTPAPEDSPDDSE
jgi:lipid-binding SYLF domain-containing protein